MNIANEAKSNNVPFSFNTNLYKALFEYTQTATVVAIDTLILLVNEKFCDLTGYSKLEVEGKMHWTKLMGQFITKRALDVYYKFSNSESSSFYVPESSLLAKDGHTLYVMVFIKKLPGTQYRIYSLTDISHLRDIELALRESNKRLKELSNHLVQARELERKALAQEIHDQLGQALTGFNIDVSLIIKRSKNLDPEIYKSAMCLSEKIQLTIQDVKRIATELRSQILDDMGLVASLEWLSEDFQRRTGIKCWTEIHPKDLKTDPILSVNLFRICQEALTNIIRHSHATTVVIRLYMTPDQLIFQIKDNGIGINMKLIDKNDSFGILGIKERVCMLGGRLKIKGVLNVGTSIVILLPLPRIINNV
ncbi:hypothetical protein B1778_04235 [Dehalococcoides mccartyi]|uniref:PAS/PAC sensor signal transduction histidine kinase n=1 Tax=Dehalococcoides mccartyi TaxID=61435 RepID=A0AB33HVL2_9CHLR|nr:PAS domain-containing sensor histidine kinase [Dehalococcoides mccartyi]AQU05944.1 hypothetical protein B1777_04420 [Dehalococcoides mccartyi]AQU07389.1 hypothetical protein B1778_04235 [Dehalococcoides mccartyi]AQW62493.1 hypothetical protein B1779_04250 [Dehalococcoides mccartyi]BAZ97414.1 PAS/PAC sensor signal transduction histidine kinase [Dehalococcoides mccartyi]